MDKRQAEIIGAAVEGALREVATRFNLTLEFKGGRFDATGYRPSVEFKEAGAAEDTWKRYASLYRVPVEAFGKSYLHRGRTYTVAGLLLKSRTKPVLMKRDDGKQFVFPTSFFRPSAGPVEVSRG